jgi:hypothetical protein
VFAAYVTVTIIAALFTGIAAVTYLIGHEYPKAQADLKRVPRYPSGALDSRIWRRPFATHRHGDRPDRRTIMPICVVAGGRGRDIGGSLTCGSHLLSANTRPESLRS